MDEYQKALRLEEKIDDLIHKYRDTIQNVLDRIRNWTWDDPVSLLYSELFEKEVICDYQPDKEKISAELARRQIHNIPPGYKDAGKNDSGIGDLIIWLTILEIGKMQKKSVVFVSGDEKADWWHRSEGQALYPRYELVDEFRRSSNGQSFHIITFSHFLEIYGASENIVQEVREEEKRQVLELGAIGEFIRKWQDFEQAILLKYQEVATDTDATTKRQPIMIMLNILLDHEAITGDLFHRARLSMIFRNKLVHEQIFYRVDKIREEIFKLDELIDEL